MKTLDPSDELTYAQAYIKLRCYIDAIQANAITFCFKDDDLADRQKRFAEVEATLQTTLKLISGIPGPGGCENGFYNCDGVCVPYPCTKP